jgi:nucleoside-diphosphate-sugar epimerase
MTLTCLITGATGFVGGHLAEACRDRGFAVQTIARPGSDTSRLTGPGTTIHSGDLTDPEVIGKATAGVDLVLHCAAKVGDWGPVEDYRAVNVEALRSLLEACRARPPRRFVHLSTLGVYAARHHRGTTEEEPLPASHVDGYTQTKVEAEQLVQLYHRQHGLPTVILRPGFIYGPRDRTLLPNLIDKLKRRRLRYIGSGRQALNTIYVGNLVDAVFLAVEKPRAVGQVYNLTDGEYVSKRRFIEALVRGLDLPDPLPVSVPLWVGRLAAWWYERRARRRGATRAPSVTQAGVKFMGLNLDFSIEKARRELGYAPRFSFDKGMELTVAWYRHNP